MINKLRAFVANVKASMEYRAAVNETIRELSKLSNHELNDIGIARGDIWYIAHTTYEKPNKVKAEDFRASVNDNLKGFV